MSLCADLKRDHRGLLRLLTRAARTSAGSRAARSLLFERAHATFEHCADREEGQLLPAVRARTNGDDPRRARRLEDSLAELAVARRMFDDLRDTDPGDPRWIARLIPLSRHVERRIERDHRELFPLAQKIAGRSRGLRGARARRKKRDEAASLWV